MNHVTVSPKQIYELAVEKGWYDGVNVNDPQWQLAQIGRIVGELGECVSAIQFGIITSCCPMGEGFGALDEELADARILIDQFSYAMGIDIDKCVEMKYNCNKKRKHKHGGKLI